MAVTYTFDSAWPVESTVEVQADGTLKEVSGKRDGTHKCNEVWAGPGTVFPSVQTWVTAMVAEWDRRAPWFGGRLSYKLSYRPATSEERSSVVWVPSSRDFLEVRRGDQTKFAATERRHWLTVEEWLQHCQPKAEVPAAAPVVVVSEVPAAVPVIVDAFDPEAFMQAFAGLKEWIQKQTDPHVYTAGVIQATTWLLEATVPADASVWLKKNPAWRYSVRAIFQAYGWNANMRKEGVDAVTAFLEKF